VMLMRQNVTNGDRFPCCSELQTLNFTRKVSTIELTYFHLMLLIFFFFLIVRKEPTTRTISILLLLKGPGQAYGGPSLP